MGYKLHKQYRLPGFDYAGEGEYFVTICIADRRKFFGKINDGKMLLSPMGKTAEKIWNEIPDKFKNTRIDTYQIMPDHLHGIINLKEDEHLINQMPTLKSGIKNNPMESTGNSLGKIVRWFKGRV